MQADDDVPTLQQLLERNRVLQHDFEQAEHHRQTNDDRDPYDAAEHDLVEFIRKHRPRQLTVELDDRSVYVNSLRYIAVYGPGDRERRNIPFDEPATGDRSS